MPPACFQKKTFREKITNREWKLVVVVDDGVVDVVVDVDVVVVVVDDDGVVVDVVAAVDVVVAAERPSEAI